MIAVVLLGIAGSAKTLGFTFTPAGLLFPYYIGVGYKLRERGLLRRSSPLGGSSAGSIIAAALACELSESEVRRGLDALLAENRAGVRLNQALRRVLDSILAEDAHIIAQKHQLAIGYVAVLPWPRRHVVTEWTSKQDLIDVICASCNWPLFFSQWPLVWCRNSLCADGFFSVPRARFGCPPLEGATRSVAVSALPSVSLRGAFDDADIIQPGGPRFVEAPLPLAASEWFSYALSPADDAVVDAMVSLGRTHAAMWADTLAEASAEV
jgi:hypothetical protein